MPIIIDAVTYDVGIVEMDIDIDKLYDNAGRSQNGTMHKQLIGVFYNVPRVLMGRSELNSADYFSLLDVISDTSEFHSITIPDITGTGDITFDAYFDKIKHRVKRWQVGSVWMFSELTFAIIAKSPARTP